MEGCGKQTGGGVWNQSCKWPEPENWRVETTPYTGPRVRAPPVLVHIYKYILYNQWLGWGAKGYYGNHQEWFCGWAKILNCSQHMVEILCNIKSNTLIKNVICFDLINFNIFTSSRTRCFFWELSLNNVTIDVLCNFSLVFFFWIFLRPEYSEHLLIGSSVQCERFQENCFKNVSFIKMSPFHLYHFINKNNTNCIFKQQFKFGNCVLRKKGYNFLGLCYFEENIQEI